MSLLFLLGGSMMSASNPHVWNRVEAVFRAVFAGFCLTRLMNHSRNKVQRLNNRYIKGFLIILVGATVSALPLIWPLTTDQYDPQYGKLPLWLLANCGVIALSAAYCAVMVAIFGRLRWLWIPFLGFLLVPVALLAGFAFWALGLVLIPVGPVLLLIAGLIAIQSKKSEKDATDTPLPAGQL